MTSPAVRPVGRNPDLTEECFAAIDTNADGAADVEEITAAEEAGVLPAS